MDARQRRTQQRLYSAVLRLAGAEPVGDLSVTRLAAAAGVHRSTFYEHASSAEDLLRLALLDELDALRAGLLDDPSRDTAAAVDDVTRRVVEHVRRYASIYRRGLADDSGRASLDGMLSEHFLGSIRRLLEQGRVRLPDDVAGVEPELVADAAARFVAQGTVGALEAWLRSSDLDVDTFGALYARLRPDWWRQS